jgi:hypothetical protein
MTAALLWIARIFIIYCVIKIVYSLIRPARSKAPGAQSVKEHPAKPRFDTKGKKVAEGDFKEL